MTRLAYIPNRIIDHNGIADGATVHVYLTGTTTPILLYSDSLMTVSMANPFTVVAGAAFPPVFYDSSVNIKLTIVSALDGSIEEYDPYNPLTVSVSSPFVSLKAFGAVGDGVTNDAAAMTAALAFLRALNINPGTGGYYTGSPRLYAPAGNYNFGTTIFDIDFGCWIEGEGSGMFGPSGGASTQFTWSGSAGGLRFQHPNTSAITTVDGTAHRGCSSPTMIGIKLEGSFSNPAGTESESHALVARKNIFLIDVHAHNWAGDGFVLKAGNQTGGGTFGGDVSLSTLMRCKAEGCRVGFDTRGGDANVVRMNDCDSYQNRQAGFIDDNGAGSNTYIACHTASNGLISGAKPTQCTSGGNHYAAKWGGDFTVAPSGTTADTANWLYIEAGSADATRPAHTTTAGTFRAGGDYVTLNSAGVMLVNCYSEYGGFSQFNGLTLIEHGSIGQQYFRGGQRVYVSAAGYTVQLGPSGVFRLQSRDGEAGVFAYDQAGTGFGYLDFIKTGDAILNGITGVAFRHGGVAAGHIDTGGLTGVAAVTATGAVTGSNLSGTNTGDQTAGAGITLSGGAFSAKFKNLFNSFADVQNSTTTETDIFTNTTAAGELAVNGDRIEAQYSGAFVSSATATRQLKVKFAGTTIFDSGALTISTSGSWRINVTIIRVSATVIRYEIDMLADGVTLTSPVTVSELTGLTLSNTNILKLTGTAAGTGAATGDITGKLSAVDKKAA